MASFGNADLALGLKVISTVSAGIYAGGAWFIAYGSTPAARSLKPSCLLKVTKAVLPRCAPMPVSHTISTLAAAGVYFASGESKENELGWLGGAAVMGLLAPYTMALIAPINKSVMKDEVAESEAPSVMESWSNYHLMRTIVASGVFLYFTYKIAKQ